LGTLVRPTVSHERPRAKILTKLACEKFAMASTRKSTKFKRGRKKEKHAKNRSKKVRKQLRKLSQSGGQRFN
jgi:hypothetical protein